jgi:hypothetical protein
MATEKAIPVTGATPTPPLALPPGSLASLVLDNDFIYWAVNVVNDTGVEQLRPRRSVAG